MILSQPKPCKMSFSGALGACLLAVVALPAWSLDQSSPTVDEPATTEVDRVAVAPPEAVDVAEPAVAANPAASAADEPAEPRTTSSDADRIARLEKQIDKLLEEVQILRRVRSPSTAGIAPSLRAVAPDGKMIAVISGVGQVTLLDVATGKELARTDIGQEGTVRSIAFSPDGKHIAVQSDASEVIMLDAATGKIHRVTKQKTMTRKPRLADPESDAAQQRDPLEMPTRTTTKLPMIATSARPAAASMPSPFSGAQLDVVRLATEYSDARGNLEMAERVLEVTRSTQAAGQSTQKEMVIAEVQVKNAAQKFKLLREIAQAALQAAQDEHVLLGKRGMPDGEYRAEAAQIEAKLRILKLILSR
jgi:hypothetical protein